VPKSASPRISLAATARDRQPFPASNPVDVEGRRARASAVVWTIVPERAALRAIGPWLRWLANDAAPAAIVVGPEHAETIVRDQLSHHEYGGAESVRHRVARGGVAGAIVGGGLVAWAALKDDGSIGFLRTLELPRGG